MPAPIAAERGRREALIADNPDLRVVVREYPILPESADAARMALAAAQQGKYDAFHQAMYGRGGRTGDDRGRGEGAGLDLDKARAAIGSGKFDPQLQTTQLAHKSASAARRAGSSASRRSTARSGTRLGRAIDQARES